MTATTVGALLIGREELASPDSPRNVLRLVGQVAFITALVELVGVVILAVHFLAQVRGREEVGAFGRKIPISLIVKSLTVGALATLLLVASSLGLMISDNVTFLTALFEVTSAFGTVGLSLGPTSELSAFGKLLLMFVMFAGRVGHITVILALSQRSKPWRYTYPEEEIAIG